MKLRVATTTVLQHVVIVSCCLCLEFARAAGGSPLLAINQDSVVASPNEGLFGGEDVLAAPAEAGPCSADEGMMDLSVTLNNGHFVTVCMSNTASEEYIHAVLKEKCDEAGVSNPRDALLLTAQVMSLKGGYERTGFWFEGGGARDVFDTFLGGLARTAKDIPLSVLEIGSFEGGSSLWFAKNLLEHPDSRMLCLDAWERNPVNMPMTRDMDMSSVEGRFRSNMEKAPNKSRINAIKGDSLLSLSSLVAAGKSSSFDIIYVDASHQMVDALSDGLLAFRLLKVGGTIIFDDEANSAGVAEATAALESALGDGLQVLHRQELVVARKMSDRWASPALVVLGAQGDEVIHSYQVMA